MCSALLKRGATEAPRTLNRSRHRSITSNTTPSAPRPTTFITGVNWQLSEMGTSNHMSVVVSANGGTRHVAPQHLLQGRLSFMDHDLYVLSSHRFQVVFSHHHFDTNCVACKRGVITNSTQSCRKSPRDCVLQQYEYYFSGKMLLLLHTVVIEV